MHGATNTPKCRRCSKNSGGRIAPAASCALIEGGSRSVNALADPHGPATPIKPAGKLLTRLNFLSRPGIG
jgi:hypothetical protein